MAIYKPKEMAKKLSVTIRTLQRWDIEGKLLAKRSPTSKRYYTDDQLMQFLGKPTNNRKVVAYARASIYGQKDDLKDQINFIRQYANSKGVILNKTITDVGSGLNYNKKSGIIHVFFCRLCGLRKYKNKIKNDKSLTKEDSEHGYENTKN